MSQLLQHIPRAALLRLPHGLGSASILHRTQTRLQSTVLTMSGNNQNNNPMGGGGGGGGEGGSRKRQYPFNGRGGGAARGRGRGNRRGGPNAPSNASPAFSTSASSFAPPSSAAAPAAADEGFPPAPTSDGAASFRELTKYQINPTLLQTIIHDMKLLTMTPVQAETLPHTLTGTDVLAQAKTGTGKTMAFLIPAIQKLVNNHARSALPRANRPITLLVISPTRELATQIGDEAKRLLNHFPDHKEVAIAVGGTNPKSSLHKIRSGCDILVATPGRLLDHLSQPDGTVARMMQGVETLVLDEADRLMDMGFLPDIQKIIKYLPAQSVSGRSGMLFSATINPRVKQFAGLVLADNYKFVSTIPVGDTQTHEHVPQSLIAVPTFSDLAPAILGALRREIAAVGKDSFKTIIFAPTAAQVDFYAFVLSHFSDGTLSKTSDLPRVSALHSRMAQGKRTATTEEFRKVKSGILVATDVVARGLDFPGVTNVFQVGLPQEKESYIHRLGRTARAGADGRGCLILSNLELPFARKTLSSIKFVNTAADLSSAADVQRAVRLFGQEKSAKTYRAWIGYYKGHVKLMGITTTQLVHEANTYAMKGLGCDEIPTVETRFVSMTGLKNVPGLNVVKTAPREPRK